jgi:branched-chain amino acid transport system substrate-binding protein
VKEFIEAYRKMFGIDPNLQSTSGYDGTMAFAFYAGLAGKNLKTGSLIAALETGKVFEDIFGGAPVSFSKDNHLGVSAATIGQIKNGRWVTIAKNQSYKSEK